MINWAELDPDFQALAKDMQSRYDGKGHFFATTEEAEAAKKAAEEAARAGAFAKGEYVVTLGTPALPDGGIPVKIEIKEDGATRWATGWFPSCVVTESSGFTESDLTVAQAYLKANAIAIFQHYLDYQAEKPEDDDAAEKEEGTKVEAEAGAIPVEVEV